MTEPAENPSFWTKHSERIGLAVLILYVCVLGVFTVNEVFRLDLGEMEMFTPELHTWVYSLIHLLEKDPADPELWRTEADIERNLRSLRDLLARTRYARLAAPGSLEEKIAGALNPLSPREPPDAARSRAEGFLRDGQAVARTRLIEIGDWVTIPIFVKYLDHEDPRLRKEVFELLKTVAAEFCSGPGQDRWKENFFGYDPDGTLLSRQEAVRRWKDWLRSLDLP